MKIIKSISMTILLIFSIFSCNTNSQEENNNIIINELLSELDNPDSFSLISIDTVMALSKDEVQEYFNLGLHNDYLLKRGDSLQRLKAQDFIRAMEDKLEIIQVKFRATNKMNALVKSSVNLFTDPRNDKIILIQENGLIPTFADLDKTF